MTFMLCFCLVLLIVVGSRRKNGIPDGPPLIPVIGNLLTLSEKDISKSMKKLREKYGDVFSLYLGQELVIVLNGYNTIHDALVRKGRLFSNRPESPFQRLVMPNAAVLFSNGKVWKEQRSFAQNALKEICIDNRANIESVLSEEVAYVLQKLGEFQGAADIRHIIHVYSLNIILRVICGERFSCEDDNARYLIDAFNDIGMDVAKMQVLVNCFPFLKSLPGDILSLRKLNSKRYKLYSLVKQLINEKLCKKQSSFTSFVDAFQEKIEKSDSEGKHSNVSFTESCMLYASCDMIGAASDTTANAIVWILLHLVREPNIQEKMFHEIDKMVGAKIELSPTDRKILPYIEAVIHEGLRISNSTPFALPHSVVEDVHFSKFFIPKGTTILVNLTSILKDPSIFKDPDVFRPERFLSSDGSEVVDVAEFTPFSMGPRSCLGESLARMQCFMVISAIVQRFKLLPAEQGKLPDTVGQLSTVYKPLPFSVRLVER